MATREQAERFLCDKYRIKDVKGVVIPSDEVVDIMMEFAEESVIEMMNLVSEETRFKEEEVKSYEASFRELKNAGVVAEDSFEKLVAYFKMQAE